MHDAYSRSLPPFHELDSLWIKLVDAEWIPRGRIKPRLVDSHAVLTVKQGRGRLTIDLRDCRADAGVSYLVSPGQTIAARPDGDEAFSLYLVRFRARREDGSEACFPASGELAPQETTAASCETLLQYWTEGGPLERFRAQAVLQEWLYALLKPVPRVSSPNSRTALERTKSYIDGHYHENLTIEQLARIAELSPKYYVDLFKKTYGLSTIDYVTEARLNQAKRMIAQSDMKLSDVAHQVGYQDEFYFSRKFKQTTGLTPSAYARNRRRKFAAYMSPIAGHLLALNLMPYAAPLHPKWTSHYYNSYRTDIPLHLSAYRFNEDWEANIAALTNARPDAVITLDYLHPGERERLEALAPLLVIPAKETDWRQQLRVIARFANADGDAESWLAQYERKLRLVRESVRRELGDESILPLSFFKGQFYYCPTRGMTEIVGQELRLNLLRAFEDIRYNVPITAEKIAELDADRILLNICQEPETLAEWRSRQASSLWQDLQAVRRNKVYELPSDPWREYSAHAAGRMTDDLARRLCGDRPDEFRR
ncbi:AraC family transcriptional regulator [Cohnella cellulosilytica]|uniref:AraC family transcriptional regulator n=1 Tax=Cohnella cellulosilytica TaxID=986710 RepID=A0ABW2FCJ0_9BACL